MRLTGSTTGTEVNDEKPLRWIHQAYKELTSLSAELQDAFGNALNEVQQGETPSNAKTLHGKLSDVMEIRVNDASGTYRTMYTVKLKGVVYVLGSFQKKSKSGIATPKADLDRILDRLKAAREHYKQQGPDD